jgi:hypothetical protein
VEEEGQGHSLGDADYSSGFILEDIDNYHGQRELFSGHSGPQNSAINVQGITSVFLLFSSRDIFHKIVVETNRYAEQFKNSRGRCLCGLAVRVPGYRSRGPGFDSWRYQIF